MFTFLLGGVRSGKSSLAVELGRRHAAAGGTVTFVATAPRIEGDDDLDARIAAHRADRPAWPTIEAPLDVTEAIGTAGDALVVVDCVTLWVNNLLHRGDDDDAVAAAVSAFTDTAARRAAPTVVVSNEVGLGVHPATDVGRRYRDVLGHANRLVASGATTTLFLAAGRAVRLDDPCDLV